jgi:hypothetical protein
MLAVALAFVLGINEAVTVPRGAWNADRTGAMAVLRDKAALARGLGARAVRVQSGTYPWIDDVLATGEGWERVDEAMALLAEHDLDVVIVVAPWPGNRPWERVNTCEVSHPERVGALVERYDGDGVDDAPGAATVVAWEVDSEPDLHATQNPEFCPPSAWAAAYGVIARAIRGADERARIVTGGLYRPHADSTRDWLAAVGDLAPPPDARGVHVFPSPGADLPALLDAGAVGRGSWITEVSIAGSGGWRRRARAEAEQARVLVATALAAREREAGAMLWHTLADPPVRGHSPLRDPGLLRSVGSGEGPFPEPASRPEKPAAVAFRALSTASGDVGRDGTIAWIAVDGGWLVCSWGRVGEGRPPGALEPLPGARARERADGTWRLSGVAFAAATARESVE